MVKYKFSNDGYCLTIYDSHAVPKADFQKTLNQIKAIHGTQPIFQRDDNSLKKEWATHNALYGLHYKRSQTKDCDFDIPSDKPEWLYCLVGTLVWLFIK